MSVNILIILMKKRKKHRDNLEEPIEIAWIQQQPKPFAGDDGSEDKRAVCFNSSKIFGKSDKFTACIFHIAV